MKKILCFLLFAIAAGLSAIEPELIMKRGESVTVQKYPDADSVLLYDLQTVEYQPDGTAVETDDFYQKILNEKGRREQKSLNLWFNPVYGTAEVSKLEILRDGRIIPVDIAANSRISVDASQMQSNIYDPNQRQLTVSIPDLQTGDILHITANRRTVKPRIPNVWSDIFVLQSDTPILEYVVRINAPEALPLRATAVKDPVKGTLTFTESRGGGRIIYTWRAVNVPQIHPEPDMPPVYTCAQRLLVSTVPSWQDISRWYSKLCRPRLDAVTPEMKQKALELTAGAKSTEEKIMRIFQFVSQNIRYMGITTEKEAPGYEPHDVSMTFNNRYGVCRDKAALLVAMLELAGIEAYPVLFYAGEPKDAEVPNNYFNHAITAAKGSDGKLVLMDPTFETTTELLPSALSGMSYLVAKPAGDTLRTSPTVPAEDNMLSIRNTASVSRTDGLTCRTVMNFTGVNDQIFRSFFSRNTPEVRRQFFAGKLKKAVPGAELKELKIYPENIRDMSAKLKVELIFSAPFPLKNSGIFPLQGISPAGVFSQVLNMAGSMELDSRCYPLVAYSSCAVEDETVLTLPEGVVPAAPLAEVIAVKSPALNFRGRESFKDGVLTSSSKLTLDKTRISPAEYKELKRAIRELEQQSRACTLFHADGKITKPEKEFAKSDAVMLLNDSSIVCGKDGSCETTTVCRLKVLNYAGVKNFSELNIKFNPAFESVEIKDASVTSPDGKEYKLTAKELNIMDADWVGGAPRYPAGKILVANFPGVRPGSVIQYTTVEKSKSPWGRAFSFIFGNYIPVLHRKVSVKSGGGVKISALGLPGTAVTQNSTWEMKNIPPVLRENSAPSLRRILPGVKFSTGNYEKFSKLVLDEVKRLSANQPAAAAKAGELFSVKGEQRDKVLVIRDFIAKNIRNAGTKFTDLPLSALTPADKTLQDGYGNSADRAILFKSMLDAAGIPNTVVAASPTADTPENREFMREVPNPEEFGNLLIKVRIDGETWYLNDGSQYSAPGASNFDGCLALNLENRELFRLNADKHTVEEAFHIDIILDKNGNARLKITERFSGTLFGSEKRRYTEFTPEKMKQHIQSLVNAISPSGKINGDLHTDFKLYPATLRYQVDIADFAPRSGNFRQIKLPGFTGITASLRTWEKERKLPLLRPDSLEYRYSYRIAYPDEWEAVTVPGSFTRQTRLETVMVSCHIRNKSIDYRAEVEARAGELTPAEYAEMAQLQAKLDALPMRVIIFNTKR